MMILSQERSLLQQAQEQFEKLIELIDSLAQEHERSDRVERNLFDKLLSLGHTLLKSFVARQGTGDVGPTIESAGSHWRRLEKVHDRRYVSIFGELVIPRTVYGTRETQKIQAVPLDAQLVLPEGEFSYVLEDWLQRMCLQDSFAESVASLATLLHLRPSVRSAEEMNHRLAEYNDEFRQEQPPISAAAEPAILVFTAAGKGVVMRQPDRPRDPSEERAPEPIRDRAAADETLRQGKTGTKRMAYVGAIYSIEPFVRRVADVMDELQRRECQARRPRPVGKRVWAEMTRVVEGECCNGKAVLFEQMTAALAQRNPAADKIIVCLMDGERALWEAKRTYVAEAVEILDRFHARERLWQAAHIFHPQGSKQATQFVDDRLRMMLEGKVNRVIGGFRQMITKHKLKGNQRARLRQIINYYDNNRQRMKYDEYLAAGYPIGSGVAEGACRHLVKDRLEGTGMRWRQKSAQSMLHLRAIYLNGDWDDFIEHRIQAEQQRLYGKAA